MHIAIAKRLLAVLAVLLATGHCRAQLFDAPVAFGSIAGPNIYTGLLPVDLDNDGDLDVIAARNYGFALETYFGDGAGGFSQGPIVSTPGSNFASSCAGRDPVGAADFNGDGLKDYVTYLPFEGVRVFLNVGGGGFSASGSYNFGLGVEYGGTCIGDFDGDGLTEIAVCGSTTFATFPGCSGYVGTGGGNVRILRYDAITQGIVLLASFNFPAERIYDTVAGDFDADGITDLALVGCTGTAVPSTTASLRCLRFPLSSSPAFSGPWTINININAGNLLSASGDVDGDGADDWIGVQNDNGNYPTGNLETFWAAGSGVGLSAPSPSAAVVTGIVLPWSAGMGRDFLHPADVDGDGVDEIVTSLSVARIGVANSTAALTVAWPWTTGSQICSWLPVATGDFDNDGDADVIISSFVVGPPTTYNVLSTTLHYVRSNGVYRNACTGPNAGPRLKVGMSYLGNPAYYLAMEGAPPNSPCVFGVTLGPGNAFVNGCSLWLSTYPTDQILPYGDFGFGTTDGTGKALLGMSLPSLPAMLFQYVYVQGAVLDVAAPFSVGGASFGLTEARRVVFW